MQKIVIAALTMSALSCAVAGGPDQNENQPAPKGGLYLGGGMGWGALDVPKYAVSVGKNSPIIKNKNKTNGFAARVNAGYLFNVKNNLLLGAEAGWNYLPEAKNTLTANVVTTSGVKTTETLKSKYDNYAFDLMAVAKYYFTDQFNLFGKFGGAYMHQDITLNVTQGDASANLAHLKFEKTKIIPVLSVGAGYEILPNLEATVTYTHGFGEDLDGTDMVNSFAKGSELEIGKSHNKIPSYNTVLAGVNYYFNV